MDKELKELINDVIKNLKLNTYESEYIKMCLELAFAYGSKDELLKLINK